MTGNMAGLLVVLLLIYVSHVVAMDTAETGSTGGESSYHLELPFCECEQEIRTMLGCICRNLSGLANEEDRVKISEYLSADPQITIFLQITIFTVKCEQTSSTNISGLFDFLPPSVKKLKINDCTQQYMGKEVFYGMRNVQDLTITIESNAAVQIVFGNYSDFFNYSRTPIKVDFHPELFQSTPQLQHLALTFLYLDRFPKALYQEVNGTYPLPNLKNLDLSKNKIPYLRPEYLQHLTNLRVLDLTLNRISNLSTSFPFLPGLQMLSIGSNRIKSLAGSPFQNLSNLQTLSVPEQFSSDLHSAKHSWFDILGAGAMEYISSTSFLGLSNLKTLQLSSSIIRSIPNGAFTELENLQELNISDGLLDDIGASAFQGLSLLKSLDLSYNNLSTIDPVVFDSLSSLLSLYLQDNVIRSLSPSTFENMPYLEYLNLGNNRITTLTPETLRPLKNLRTLDVHGNQIYLIEYIFLGIESDHCENIDVSYNNVQSLDIKFLEGLGIKGKTVNVDLSHNSVWFMYFTEAYHSAAVEDLTLKLDLRWNQFTSLPFLLAIHQSFNRSRIAIEKDIAGQLLGDISLQITHNPLVCGCWLYELVSNLDVAKQGVLYTKTDFEHMECAFPDTLRGRKVVDLSPSELWCPKECYNRWYYCYCYENTGELFMQSDSQCQPELKTCPSECSCLYQGQLHSSTAPYNELVNCSWKNLSSIPDDISNVTTILHLEGNQLTVINQTVLPKLLIIRELYLNDNNISYVGDMSFNNFISLEILRLDGNNISEINSQVFKSLSEIRELYLNHSGVRHLAADSFHNLTNLRELHLENNKLKSLPENLFSGLKLTLLGIYGNPLICGCDVLWFANWLQRRTHLLSQGRTVSCVADGKLKRDILTLSAAQFDCDDLQAAQARTRLIIGLSLALVLVTIILVFVIVIVKRKEDIQVYLYARYGWRFREEEEDDEDKEYDAFLSYSQHDLDVVLQDVLPALENREPPFRVCLHHRDFLPGVPIAENILNAVSASKRTIILLSNNFLESDWCQLEFQAAHAQMLQDRANRVIVILLDDIPAENAPADIQHYLKTNTYLKWGDERFWERLIYAMPRPRPHAQNEDGDQLAMVELDHNG